MKELFKLKEKPIDHRNCHISTGISGNLTFGRGELDDYGYWEIPCPHCAREWEKKHPKDGTCWPF